MPLWLAESEYGSNCNHTVKNGIYHNDSYLNSSPAEENGKYAIYDSGMCIIYCLFLIDHA